MMFLVLGIVLGVMVLALTSGGGARSVDMPTVVVTPPAPRGGGCLLIGVFVLGMLVSLMIVAMPEG
jgi:hypothetical protein